MGKKQTPPKRGRLLLDVCCSCERRGGGGKKGALRTKEETWTGGEGGLLHAQRDLGGLEGGKGSSCS